MKTGICAILQGYFALDERKKSVSVFLWVWMYITKTGLIPVFV